MITDWPHTHLEAFEHLEAELAAAVCCCTKNIPSGRPQAKCLDVEKHGWLGCWQKVVQGILKCARIDSSTVKKRCCHCSHLHQRFILISCLLASFPLFVRFSPMKKNFVLVRQTLSMSLQHGIQLVSQIIKHVADVIQNISCCLYCAAATVNQTGSRYNSTDTVRRVTFLSKNLGCIYTS